MCLPFYSAPIHPPNDKCKSLVSRLKVLFYIQIVMAIFKCFFLFSSSSSGDAYLDMFGCCAIYLAYSQISHMGCVIHIFLSLYSFITEFVVIGTYVQDGIALFGTDSTTNLYMCLILFSFFFYIVAIWIVFQAYKEFKAVSIEGLLQAQNYGGYYDQEDEQDYYGQQFYQQPQPQPQPQSQPRPQSQQQQPQPQPRANQNVQMSNTSNSNNNNQSSSSGGFQAFKGTGVKIGGS